MRFNKFVLAFCLWFTVYAGQAAAVDTNDGSVYSTAIANANAVTVRATYVVVSKQTNATDPTGNGTHHGNNNSTTAKCAEISHLTELVDLVSNSTKLAAFQAKHNLTTAEMQKLKDMAANATAQLTQLKSNTTLVKDCATLHAAAELKSQCKEMQALTQLAQLANNATELQDLQKKYNLTAAQMQEIKNVAANATAMLTKLQSNSTLVADCQNLKTNRTNNGTTTGMSKHETGIACFANSLQPQVRRQRRSPQPPKRYEALTPHPEESY